jgi:Cu2+-exporting ATPase
MITGESKPVSKKTGSNVIGGTVNIDGAIRVEVTKTGEKQLFHKLYRLLNKPYRLSLLFKG